MPTRYLRIPHIRQKANSDCLVACAMMMLAAVGVSADYGRLHKLLGIRDAGAPYSRLRLLSQLQPDLRVTLQQGTLQHLIQAIDAGNPPTIFVFTRELPYWSEAVYHAVVLVGYTETNFSIHDPAFAQAPQVASIGDVDLAWLENDSYFAVLERRS